jgi:hypothetical protein
LSPKRVTGSEELSKQFSHSPKKGVSFTPTSCILGKKIIDGLGKRILHSKKGEGFWVFEERKKTARRKME